MHFIIQTCCMQSNNALRSAPREEKTKVDTSQMLICQTRPLPAHHRRISAHDGDWEMQMQKPKPQQTLAFSLLKTPFPLQRPSRMLVRPPAVRKVDTVRPRNGHIGEPREAGGCFAVSVYKVCCCAVRCSMGMGNCVRIQFSSLFVCLHWPFAVRVTTQHE
ncbi:hypothetical protein J3F84DRAFT_363589 [Trichoderma pleuroticola]